MSTFHMNRVDELLAEDAIWGLDDEAREELQRLLTEQQLEFDSSWQHSAAVATLALQQKDVHTPSPVLIASLRAAAPHLHANLQANQVVKLRANPVNMLLAAALLMLGVVVSWDGMARSGGGSADLDPVELRQALIRTGDAAVWGWTGQSLQGDVVWDGRAQRGVMRFRGLSVNDPSVQQYQLWIFDAQRNEAHPVDGGVFDIPSANGDVVIPIDPKIIVHEAQAFVVTVEAPGGVVVSSREQVVGQAKPQ